MPIKMKILYTIQATGNGHISRAIQILPHLKKYGEVDVFLSGSNSNLSLPFPVKYRSRGLSLFYTNNGGLDYKKIWKSNSYKKAMKEASNLPVQNYDLVLNDFEHITSEACKKIKKPSVHVGHQASFISNKVPRPSRKDLVGEYLFVNFVKSNHYLGLHFKAYDKYVIPPIIKENIRQATPIDGDHFLVYLPAIHPEELITNFNRIGSESFHVFTAAVRKNLSFGNVHFHPIDSDRYDKMLISCKGLITGGGFEAPAEALYLQKKLMVVPIGKHYEQQCNAVALEQMGIHNVKKYKSDTFYIEVEKWLNDRAPSPLIENSTPEDLISKLMNIPLISSVTNKVDDANGYFNENALA